MDRLLGRLPVLVIAGLVLALAMLIPAGHAEAVGERRLALIFAGSGAGLLVLWLMLGIATAAAPEAPLSRGVLVTLLGVFALLPLPAAIPFAAAMPDTGLFNAWWEMLSCLTTTGASLYAAELVAPTLHLWRGILGWLGGLFILTAAIALMAPMRVGGFEIMDRSTGSDERFDRIGGTASAEMRPGRDEHMKDPARRLIRWGMAIAPVYAGLTVALWAGLVVTGQGALGALLRAMGTLSTSGIGMDARPVGSTGGIAAEALVALFLLAALSRRAWPGGDELRTTARLRHDPELRVAAGLVALVTLTLVLRPFLGAFLAEFQPVLAPEPAAPDVGGGLARAAGAAWGSLFTALSFLTTTGWTSIQWEGARAWAGLTAPGLMLAGLAIMGGGVATTAGGVKLLRVFALALHARRELDKIVHPASVAGGGPVIRRLRGPGAYLAFIFFMVFAMSIMATIALVSLRAVTLETATILSVAALTNTGPLAEAIPLIPVYEGSVGIAGSPWQGWAGLAPATKAVLAAAMVAGRLEMLAILALLTPGAWRR
ncbi:TrkH family potassium uptake protein [Paracoccus sp. (in: a-proteobacteria)]